MAIERRTGVKADGPKILNAFKVAWTIAATEMIIRYGNINLVRPIVSSIFPGTSANFEAKMYLTIGSAKAVSYTHLRAHETVLDLVCRLLLEKKNNL